MGGEEDSKKDGKEIGSGNGMGGGGIPASPKSRSEDRRSSQGSGKRTSAKGRKGKEHLFGVCCLFWQEFYRGAGN